MATPFPKIAPSSRSFSAPTFPTTSLVSQSGVTTRRLWGSRPSKGTLDLQFNNVNDEEAGAILNSFSTAKGSVNTLTLPDEIFAGVEDPLKSWLDGSATGAGLVWCFTEGSTPQVDSVSPGRSNVRISLTAELRMS